MPRSKRRKPHHDQSRQGGLVKTGKNKSAVPVAVIFIGLIGVGIGYFATDGSIPWLIVGLILGVGAGYLFGKQFDKSFSKK
jgi:F0F1-type ATP synthase assembly protein I